MKDPGVSVGNPWVARQIAVSAAHEEGIVPPVFASHEFGQFPRVVNGVKALAPEHGQTILDISSGPER